MPDKTLKKDSLGVGDNSDIATVNFLSTAYERFQTIEARDRHNREGFRDNLKFVYNIDNGQWPQHIIDERNAQNRPYLTSNKLRIQAAHVVNNERAQRIAGNVRPVDDKADVATAQVISGMIRYIEHKSNAERVYTIAGEHAVTGNVGYWRIITTEIEDSFEQELRLKEILEPLSVYMDPHGNYAFIRTRMTKSEYNRKYPGTPEDGLPLIDSESREQWYSDEDIYVSEYYYKERVDRVIVEFNDSFGKSIVKTLKSDFDQSEFKKQGLTEVRRKKTDVFVVKWAVITGSQVLERGEWAGKDIPIVEVEGDWIWLDGKLHKYSLIEGAKDDQRMYNYWKTNLTEKIALAIKAPYLVTKKMIDGFEYMWDEAAIKLKSYLLFKPDKGLTPRREPAPQMDQGSAGMLEICRRDIQESIGRSDAGLGQRSNERSGKAIDARALQGDAASFHFPDNYRRAVIKSTKMLVDLIPKIYDTRRIQNIIKEDGEHLSVPINQDFVDIDPETQEKALVNFNLSVGSYDVVEDVKLMSTRRQETLRGMTEFSQGSPQLQLILAGQVAELNDWPGAKELSEKINKLLPALLGINPEGEGSAQPGGVPGENKGV